MATMQGDLAEYGLMDLVQFLHGTRKQGHLMLRNEHHRLQSGVFFTGGEIVHAYCPPQEGERAFYQLLRWQQGQFAFHKDHAAPQQTIAVELKSLLLEGMRRFDEYKVLRDKLPPFTTVLHVERDSRKVGDIRITQNAWKLLSLVNGRRTIGELIDQSARDELYAVKVIGQMLASGLVSTVNDDGYLKNIVLAKVASDDAARNRTAPPTILASLLLNQIDGKRALWDLKRAVNCAEQDFVDDVHLLLRTGWVRIAKGADDYQRYF